VGQSDTVRSFLKAVTQKLSDPGYLALDIFFRGILLLEIKARFCERDQPLDADPGEIFVGLEFVEKIIHFRQGNLVFIDSYIPLSPHPSQIIFKEGSGHDACRDVLSHSEKFLSLIERPIIEFHLQ